MPRLSLWLTDFRQERPSAVDKLREAGEKAGLLRVISAWPFPVKGFAELPDSVKNIITVESCVATDDGRCHDHAKILNT